MPKYEKIALEAIQNVSNQRTRDIIIQRFGLEDGQRRTLDAIGKKYGITRERVRQVEEAAFLEFKKDPYLNVLKPAFAEVDNFFKEHGQVAREERLLSTLTETEHPSPARGALCFILTLGEPYHHFTETISFYPFWTNSPKAVNQVQQIIDFLVKRLEEEKKPVDFKKIAAYLKEQDICLNNKAIFSYLDATKHISQNNFGQYGLRHWSEINPRGVRDKAYIVFKQHGQPLHFRGVTDLINQANFGSNIAQPQTVHNELIKDNRFVLVGRGIYALSEWGYSAGTVKDVIVNILKEKGPLTKKAIIKQVLKNRLVKENTVLINLQNQSYFCRDEQGRYLVK